MADLLAEGSAWLEAQRTKHLTRKVLYLRGAEAVEVLATIGRTVFMVEGEFGIRERHEARDYLILASDLILGGGPVLPKAGDQVREASGDKVFVYEVMGLGNESPWRYSDPYRQTFRIHTKHVATEPLPP